jgi:hypothetical protein
MLEIYALFPPSLLSHIKLTNELNGVEFHPFRRCLLFISL